MMQSAVLQSSRISRDRLTIPQKARYLRCVPEPTSGGGRGGGALSAEDAAARADVALVQAVAEGDRQALAKLYSRYSPCLLAVAQRILGERREAEDLLHDVFLEVWRQAAQFDAARGTVRAWLLMRMRSRSLDRRKSAGFSRVVALEDQNDVRATSDDTLGPDRNTVRNALQALPEDQRLVLELGYFEGLSSTEIAARIDAPVGTVKSRVAAALAKLRAGLGAPGGAR
jgi:RNA polymerase sigma-70 factor (ECF subfamily)